MSDIGSGHGEHVQATTPAASGSQSPQLSPNLATDRLSGAEEISLQQTEAELQAELAESVNASAQFATENAALLAELNSRQTIILELSSQLTVLADDVESLSAQVEELKGELATLNTRYEDMLARHQRQILSIQQINTQDLARVEISHLREKSALLEELTVAQGKLISFHELGWGGDDTVGNGASASALSADNTAPTGNGG